MASLMVSLCKVAGDAARRWEKYNLVSLLHGQASCNETEAKLQRPNQYTVLWNVDLHPYLALTAKSILMTSGHYNDVIMGEIASQITSLAIVYSTVYSDADQRKHQSSASLAFVRGIHRGPVNTPHKWPITMKMFPFDDVKHEINDCVITRSHCIGTQQDDDGVYTSIDHLQFRTQRLT